MREEVVDVAEARLCRFGQDEASLRARDTVDGVDRCIAIETVPLLVTAKRTAD